MARIQSTHEVIAETQFLIDRLRCAAREVHDTIEESKNVVVESLSVLRQAALPSASGPQSR